MLRHHRRLVLLLCATLPLAGCFTGERPTLVPAIPIDDPAAATVVTRLDRARSTDFTATYDITPSTTGGTTEATVARLGQRLRIEVGDVIFTSDGTTSRTCRMAGQACSDFLDDARISDLNITHLFWGSAFAARLELDANRRIGSSTGSTTTIAGQRALCVDVVLPSAATSTGTVTYCALDAGPLARYFGADVSIEMTSFSFDVTEADLAP